MKKSDLVSELANKTGLTKTDATYAMDTLTELIAEALVRGESVRLSGLGTWTVKQRAARKGINPLTKEKITIPARRAATFKASSELKKKL